MDKDTPPPASAALEEALRETPRGAFALAGLTHVYLLLAWLAMYFFVFCRAGKWAEPCQPAPSTRSSPPELRWTLAVGFTVALISAGILWAAITHFINPPSNFELIDPKTLHLSPEFTESNLGTTEANGQ